MSNSLFNIRNVPYDTLYDYRKQMFPECLWRGPMPALSMESPEDWVMANSLRLFMRYKNNKSTPNLLQDVDLEDLRAFRAFILPDHLITNEFFATGNSSNWVNPTHFYFFLDALNSGDEDLLLSTSPEETFVNGTSDEIKSHCDDDDDDDDDGVSQCSEDSDSEEANCTHLGLVGFPNSSPMVIRRNPSSNSEVFDIYPNVDFFMDMYLENSHYQRQTFPEFYQSNQPVYAVPSSSEFARNFVRRVPGSPVQIETDLYDHEYPEKYKAALLDNPEIVRGFMAMAKAASEERKIPRYRR